MKFSICIPNYNYAHYLGYTFSSIKAIDYANYEVLVSDNASTDSSIDVIKEAEKQFHAFKYQVNNANLGFAANLDKVAALASGDYMIMLSSDDLVNRDVLQIYDRIAQKFPGIVISSAWDIIDSKGNVIGRTGPKLRLWTAADKDAKLSGEFGCDVYRMKSATLLKRCLHTMITPFNFCTVAYPREKFGQVGGYGASRLMNPDKWFHWRLLTQVEEAVFVDRSLFQYRWHNQNQVALETSFGYLKYMVDEYRNTIEVTDTMLQTAGVTKKEVEDAFMKYDIYQHGVGEFLKGRWVKSMRVFFFGLAVFPSLMIKNLYFIPYLLLLLTTPLGSGICSILRKK